MMGLFDFLKKKKGDEFGDLGAMPGMEGLPGGMPSFGPEMPGISTGMPGIPGPSMPNMGMGMPQQRQVFQQPEMAQPIQPVSMQFGPQQMQQPQMQSMQQADMMQMVRNNTEVLSTKMDSLKAAVDRINERLDYIERYLMGRR